MHKDYRRQAYARELTGAVIAQLQLVAGITILQLSVAASNLGAKRLYESLGFKQWGLEARALQQNGDYYDEAHMGMIND